MFTVICTCNKFCLCLGAFQSSSSHIPSIWKCWFFDIAGSHLKSALPECMLLHRSENHQTGIGCWVNGKDSVGLGADNIFQRLHRHQRSILKSYRGLLAALVLYSQYSRKPGFEYCPEAHLERGSKDRKLRAISSCDDKYLAVIIITKSGILH